MQNPRRGVPGLARRFLNTATHLATSSMHKKSQALLLKSLALLLKSIALLLSAAALITTQLSCAQLGPLKSEPAPTPSPNHQAAIDEILKSYEDAIGGTEAIEGVTSYKIKATYLLSGVTGPMEVWHKAPKKRLSIVEIPGAGTLKKGFDGENNWVQTPAGTFVDNSPQEIAELERDAEVFSSSQIKRQFESMKLENKARLSGRDVHVIEGKPPKGPAEKLFFDVDSGLLVRWDMARRNARGTVFVKTHLEDYRQVGKLKMPFKVRFMFESFTFTVNLEEVQHNVQIDDAIFKKPN